jgi:hypothetical protein
MPDRDPIEVTSAVRQLLGYCQKNNWAGHDPYDALNSELFKAAPALDSRIPRLVLTQLLKRSPINVRGLLRIPKTQNSKAISLFLSSFLKLSKAGLLQQEDLVGQMIELLIALRSKNVPYDCWGYSFPWQTRTIVVPVATPNLVCTTFVATALLDAYEDRQDGRCLTMATSAAEYIVNELFWEDASACGFSYPLPGLRSKTHNANLLAAAFLCRIFKHTGKQKFLDVAMKAARYSAAYQKEDGSWFYGEGAKQRWIDNFHTGYNLDALQDIGRVLNTTEFESHVQKGFAFYKAHFFREDGAARYFHDRTYPIDIHCVAQSIISLIAFKHLDPTNVALANSVYRWAMKHMWDERGFFYYRVVQIGTIRTSYMRWSQAWMLLALTTLACETGAKEPQLHDSGVLAKA